MPSDSSDDENLELLREAQDSQFINDSMFSKIFDKSTETKLDNQSKKKLPSLRTVICEDQQFNYLKISPELRNFVAKKLYAFLEKELENKFTNITSEKFSKRKHKKGGVKLLSTSENYLKVSKIKNVVEDKIVEDLNTKKVDRYTKIAVKVPEDLLKEVVVSSEDILSKKEVENWSKRSKAPVYKYKKSKNGLLLLVEPNSNQ